MASAKEIFRPVAKAQIMPPDRCRLEVATEDFLTAVASLRRPRSDLVGKFASHFARASSS